MTVELPLPPQPLRERVGCLPDDLDPREAYVAMGRATRLALERLLPPNWDWRGKAVLDFGCGAGRALRHFIPDAAHGEFWGADIDPASIKWTRAHLSPPLHFTLNTEQPRLDLPAGKFDLVYAISVFSHLSDHWAGWLVELNRVLAPGGRLILTFMGEGMSERIAGRSWKEEDVGMTTYLPGNNWDAGGPMVLLSPWWIQEHWGRLFTIETLLPRGFSDDPIYGVHDHGVAVLVKTDRQMSIDALEAPAPSELRTIFEEMRRLRTDAGRCRDDYQNITGRRALWELWRAVRRKIGIPSRA